MGFKTWLLQEMAVKHSFQFQPEKVPVEKDRDNAGFRVMAHPGFRTGDRLMVVRDSEQVENWLNAATEQHGIHWIIGYIEPSPKSRENNPNDWATYSQNARQWGQQALQDFASSDQGKVTMPPPSPANTIVYIKPTSRLHPLTAWQQVHNIAHAVWNFNQPERKEFARVVEDGIRRLQQSVYEADPNTPPPTEAEVTVVLARLLDNLSLQRVLMMSQGELQNTAKVANTAFNSYDELMYDLLTSFLRNKGKIPLRPRGVGKLVPFDRKGELNPNPEIVQGKGVRNWVWKSLASGGEAWDELAHSLNQICVQALKKCVWGVQNGPIYPYRKLQTLP